MLKRLYLMVEIRMILCRDLNIIFIKTKKVGGTSFEIALSKYCDEGDILTPITPYDEITRAKLGYQGPTNHENQNRSKDLVNLGVTGNFRNHIDLPPETSLIFM